jgi:hypothetical protein
MPIHDWTRVRANRFHDFHQSWTLEIRNALNAGLLPPGYLAMAEQITGGPEPDVVTLSLPTRPTTDDPGGLAVAEYPPTGRFRTKSDATRYAHKANRITIYHPDGGVVAVIEVVSPGNKDSRHAARQFARKVVRAVHAGVHVLFVDPFPPRAADPHGLHNVVWPMLNGDPHRFPADTPLVAAGYEAVSPPNCHVTPFAAGRPLPDMPVFLEPDFAVTLPLEHTYAAAFADVLPMHRELLERPA